MLPSVNPGYHSHGDISAAEPQDPPFLSSDTSWADSLMAKMTIDEKIAQMLMIQAYSNRDDEHLEELLRQVKRYKVGGIIFFQGTPVKQAVMTNKLQEASEIPLLIAMDAEWGLGMRLNDVISYPRQMVLGAIQDNELIFRMGGDIAKQLKELGVHMNFSPVADINNNPANPVINTRSFGEDRENVSEKVNALFSGMQSEGLLVTAKHFPGHGDTNTDSHLGLPVLNFTRERLDSLELFPFARAFEQGISGVMVAHLHVPELDNRENRPTTLSEHVVRDLLQDEMKFRGLIVTDAMNMKGVSENFEAGEAELEAIKAGNDILLMPSDVAKVINAIKKAIKKEEITEARIDSSCRKILLAKTWLGLEEIQPVKTKGLQERLNDRSYLPLQEKLIENAITLLRDEHQIIPLKKLENLQLATLNIGVGVESPFTKMLDLYHTGSHFFYETPAVLPVDSLFNNRLAQFNTLIVSLYYTRSFGENYGIPEGVKEFINSIDFRGDMIINLFGYPYALGALGELDNADALMLSFTNEELNQRMAAQGIFGGITLNGRLPVSVGDKFPVGTGVSTKGGTRLKYGLPEEVNLNNDSLKLIESIIKDAIQNKAMPGCQVLVARRGVVVLNKSFGYHTYRNRLPVKDDDLYDLASITKIAATIPSLMKLQDQQRFSVDSTLGAYYSGMDTSDKADLLIRDVLTHQAGLKAWIPFYANTLEPLDTSQTLFSTKFNYTYPYRIGPAAFANRNIVYKDGYYSGNYSEEYPVQVAENLYLRADYKDSIYQQILASPLGKREYLYSDLAYYFLYRSVEELTDTMFYPYTWFNFYGPLGAETMGFLPLKRFSGNRIIPTENDLVFRKQLVSGYVHDPGAAMLGGICGHAGLFSNANDLAKLMQMYLNHGSYGGIQFIDSATIAEYTRCQFCDQDNRRALGFDRPVTDEDDTGPASNSATESSYGNSGFTGTIAWMDPQYDLLYIFLSNRIHPDQDNSKLVSMNIRTRIQEMIYHSIEDK